MKKFFYRVQDGDNAVKIAKRFGLCVFALIDGNNLKREVEAGDVLLIESRGGQEYTVKPFDTLSSVKKKFNVDDDVFYKNNGTVPYVFCGLTLYF